MEFWQIFLSVTYAYIEIIYQKNRNSFLKKKKVHDRFRTWNSGSPGMSPYQCTTWKLVDYVVQRRGSSEPILSNSRGVFSPRNSQTAAFSINPAAIHCLEIQSFSFILFRLVLTLNEFRIYTVINVGLRGPWRPGLRPITWESNTFQYPNLIPITHNTVRGNLKCIKCDLYGVDQYNWEWDAFCSHLGHLNTSRKIGGNAVISSYRAAVTRTNRNMIKWRLLAFTSG